jgi:hypothetical protein
MWRREGKPVKAGRNAPPLSFAPLRLPPFGAVTLPQSGPPRGCQPGEGTGAGDRSASAPRPRTPQGPGAPQRNGQTAELAPRTARWSGPTSQGLKSTFRGFAAGPLSSRSRGLASVAS